MKICSRCHLEKNDFYPYKKTICKDCVKKYDRERYKNEDRKKYLKDFHNEYMKNEDNRKRHSKLSIKFAAEWAKNNPEKIRTHYLLKYHVKKGHIIKPGTCSYCNNKDKIEAHHEDYSKPFSIVWLCRTCHKRYHRNLINLFDVIKEPIDYSKQVKINNTKLTLRGFVK